MRIVLDAMGTDHAPRTEVAGAIEALSELESDVEIVLVGDRDSIEAELSAYAEIPPGLTILHAPDRVTAADPPASVIRRKPDSSIVVGLKLHKAGDADAFVSGGSTGAVMATSLFTLRPLPGVDRLAIGTVLPTSAEPCLLLDAGANVDSKPHHLVQFAHLGNIFAQDMMGRETPRIGLLNIGEEPGKGNELSVETGRDIIRASCDVVVCDGFVGNALLKFYESVAAFIIQMLKKGLDVADTDVDLEDVFRVLDYSETGGAPLLGVDGVSIICHGASTPKAIRNALKVASRAVRSNMVEHSARELAAFIQES